MNISAEDVRNILDNNEKIVLLDVRSIEEVERGKIEGSVHIPMERLESELIEVIPDKDSKIVVYCLSGSRSSAVVRYLEDKGYKNTYSLENGLLAWRAKGYPLSIN